MIRIFIADDHTLVRQALSQMLETEPDMKVVGQAATAEDAVDRCVRLAPDVVLMDIHMPRESEGIDATRRIKAHNPRTNVIILTMECRSEYLVQAIKAGARGYLLKNANAGELSRAIRAAAAGEGALDAAMARRVLQEFKRLGDRGAPPGPDEHLTNRERDILSLLAQGARNREIAERLNISEKTVRNRLCVIFEKLQINNRTQAALFAAREGFTTQGS